MFVIKKSGAGRSAWWTAFFILVLTGCGKLKEPEFRGIENIRFVKPGFNESVLALDLHYYNPNKSKLRLKKAEGEVWIDSGYLGQFYVDSLVHIPAYSDFRIPVKLKVEMGRFFENSLLALLGKKLLIKIDGKASVGKGGVFIRIPVWYEGEHDIRELLK